MSTPTPDSRLRGARGSILTLLRRGDRTVAQIADAVGLTGNGVRLHLARLERDGLIEEHGKVPGVSKASRLYGLSPGGRLLFTRAHLLFVRGLLDELHLQGGERPVRRLLGLVGRRFARARPAHGSRFSQRVDAVVRAFRSLGGDPTVTRHGRTVSVVMHDCPLADVVSHHPEVCAFGHALVSELVEVPVAGCCTHGDRPSCRFDVSAPSAGRSKH
jgi:predicted ArsR family transcriptional regulator